MKKALGIVLAMTMVLMLTACGTGVSGETMKEMVPAVELPVVETSAPESGNRIGVAMPNRQTQRWIQDGDNMRHMLEEAGYQVDLQYADNDIATQIYQIENMIAEDCKVLVIAAVEGEALGTVLDRAKAAGIPVIAYDRLIMGSDAVSYYASFDNWEVGVRQGQFIVDALNLENAGNKVYNIEFVTGDPSDNNINFLFDGAMSVLKPYMDRGVLVTPSGQTEKQNAATPYWDCGFAQDRFEEILEKFYADGKELHAVLANNDTTAMGVANALALKYTGKYPVMTGQDCEIPNVRNMLAGKQAMSVFKDTRILAARAAEMVDALMKGEAPPVNDVQSYDNGTGVIPAFLCEPVVATPDNIRQLLIESGYYTEAEIHG